MSNRPKLSRAFAFIVFCSFLFISIPAVLFANSIGQSGSNPERQAGQTVPGTVPTRTPVLNWMPVIFKEPLPTATPIPTNTPVNTATPSTSCTPPETIDATNPDRESELQSTILVQRTSNGGLAGYVLNEQLVQAARRHARDMANLSDSQLSSDPHKGTDGSSASQRITDACFNGNRKTEIVGWGFSDTQTMMNWWMNSSVHRGIILDNTGLQYYGPTYMNIPGSQYAHYWVVTFGDASSRQADSALYQCHYVVAEEDRGISATVWQKEPCK